jgi:1,4-alpha-glucan branching enzyme
MPHHPGVAMMAEESTAWPMVSKPTYLGGLGFGYKWNMGWMHDTLEYMKLDPVFRSYHHGQITFSLIYAFTENFVLPFSHDEVVHGKGSMIGKMPGDDWRKFANLRLLYGYMAATRERNCCSWAGSSGSGRSGTTTRAWTGGCSTYPFHSGLQRWVRDINTFYRGEPALYERDSEPGGFEWIDCNDSQRSVLSFRRHGRRPEDEIVFVCNFTPEPRTNYRIGVPYTGEWRELLNGDAPLYGGSGQGNVGGAFTTPVPMHGHPQSLNLTLPPLAMLAFKRA